VTADSCGEKMTTTKKLGVLLVAGGDSSERDVSLDSGRSIHEALVELGHRVLVVDPARPDVEPTEDPNALFTETSIKSRPPELISDVYKARQNFVRMLERFRELRCDVVFNGLHGGAGEDGTFQALLDYVGIPYTGSGMCAAAVAMDKHMSKRLVAPAGVPVAKEIFVDSAVHEAVVVDDQVLEALSLPVVVKPNQEGSSVGVTIVRSRDELRKAIDEARSFGGPYLVEKYVPGKEITAAVLDFCDLPLIEIRPKDGFFDYHNKYQPKSCDYLVPAPLDVETTEAITASAKLVYRVLGCRGYARIDFRRADHGHYVFLEANVLPGLTSNSLVPKAARAAGIDFSQLIERILRLSTSAIAV